MLALRRILIAADAVGFYSLHVPIGKRAISCSYFGYETASEPMEDPFRPYFKKLFPGF